MNNGVFHPNPNPRSHARRNEDASNRQKGCCSNEDEVKFVKSTDQGDIFNIEGNQKGEVSSGKNESLPNPSLST
ncbi:hypothetical protein [[Clostridium] innocuum]|uniref:hypothetical protein n=1 Tax=Clostridium innocuum TaxID=1522 RepID=UPI0012E04664|nr:hypothetical protein [[Clostridium] innocuum]